MTTPFKSQEVTGNGRGEGRALRSELLREVNDRIREVGGEGSPSSLEFVCECGGGTCVAMVELTAGEYDGIRDTAVLVLADGHETA